MDAEARYLCDVLPGSRISAYQDGILIVHPDHPPKVVRVCLDDLQVRSEELGSITITLIEDISPK